MTVQILTEEAWALARRGQATASEFHKAIATIKSGWGASRRQYAGELIVERLGGNARNGYTNAAMQWGIDTEPLALAAYKIETDYTPIRAPDGHRFWCPHPTIPGCGATPDALVDDDKNGGIVEVKCPYVSGIHLEYYDDGCNRSDYRTQALFQLLCLPERGWVDLVSYDPRMRLLHMQLVCQRIYRDEVAKELTTLEAQAAEFVREIDARVAGYIQQDPK